jgi:hypothetical protein
MPAPASSLCLSDAVAVTTAVFGTAPPAPEFPALPMVCASPPVSEKLLDVLLLLLLMVEVVLAPPCPLQTPC